MRRRPRFAGRLLYSEEGEGYDLVWARARAREGVQPAMIHSMASNGQKRLVDKRSRASLRAGKVLECYCTSYMQCWYCTCTLQHGSEEGKGSSPSWFAG